jgi:hypothetical protein
MAKPSPAGLHIKCDQGSWHAVLLVLQPPSSALCNRSSSFPSALPIARELCVQIILDTGVRPRSPGWGRVSSAFDVTPIASSSLELAWLLLVAPCSTYTEQHASVFQVAAVSRVDNKNLQSIINMLQCVCRICGATSSIISLIPSSLPNPPPALHSRRSAFTPSHLKLTSS